MKRKGSAGLAFKKIDLHIHTPASACYEDRRATADEIVSKAVAADLTAIAITDHNTAAWVDKVTAAAKGKLTIFPGVEVSCTGGKSGSLHISCILDPTKTAKDVENLLGALSIPADKYGQEDACSPFSPSQAIDIMREHGGIPILAHANSNHGVMNDIAGVPRNIIVQNPNLLAAEATDFENSEKKKKRKRVVDLLDGNDRDYCRKLAVIQSSDSHSLDTLGTEFTYFKVDEISLEGLRQCFCDPDVRIRQRQDFASFSYPKITSLTFSQGFFASQSLTFNEGLNSIVGGKGVGKSLLIEFLRFVLDQRSEDESILNDHRDKLSSRLGNLGEVSLELALEGGEKYRVTRIYDGVDNEIDCVDLTTGEHYEGDLRALFPILAYSQNEVIRIAEDGQAQLRLIDSFIDSSSFRNKIEKISQEISKKDRELARSLRASAEVSSHTKDLKTVNEQIKVVTRNLRSKLFSEMKQWEERKAAIEEHLNFHERLASVIEDKIAEISDELETPSVEEKLALDPQVRRAKSLSANSLALLHDSLDTARRAVEKNAAALRDSFKRWKPRFDKKRRNFEGMLKKAGGDKTELEGERRRLEGRKGEIEKELEKHQKQLAKLNEIRKSRNSLLDQLDDVYKEFYESRKKVFDRISEQSSQKLMLELGHSTDRAIFKRELLALRKGSWVREADIEKVAQTLTPREFVDLILNEDVDGLATRADLAPEVARKLIDILAAKDAFEEILGIAYKAYPNDTPSIKFQKEDGSYHQLSGLSMGQKCSALLIIALSEGSRPILIDQPEDSLDNPSIYGDIVSKLRSGKEKRQFILTTHNSSVGVASDSDNFIVLRSTAECGEIECYGAIDRSKVRSRIVDHLEGGAEPYSLKSKKYNIDKG